MTHSPSHRHAAGIMAATLALGIVAPAAARPIDPPGAAVSSAPAVASHKLITDVRAGAVPAAGSGVSDWGYVAIGSGAASLVLIGVGGTRAASRRRRRTGQPGIAA